MLRAAKERIALSDRLESRLVFDSGVSGRRGLRQCGIRRGSCFVARRSSLAFCLRGERCVVLWKDTAKLTGLPSIAAKVGTTGKVVVGPA